MRNTLIAASLFATFTAMAADGIQNDPAHQRHVLEMEGVGQVLPAAAPSKAKPAAVSIAAAPRSASGLFTQPTLKTAPSRDAVIAELARARAAGEMDFMREEIGNFHLPQQPQRESRLAQWFKRGSR